MCSNNSQFQSQVKPNHIDLYRLTVIYYVENILKIMSNPETYTQFI